MLKRGRNGATPQGKADVSEALQRELHYDKRQADEYLHQQTLDHNESLHDYQLVQDLRTQGVKALLVLNSGALLAMLGLTQALIGKDTMQLFKSFLVFSLWCFLAGVGCSAFSFFTRTSRGQLEEAFEIGKKVSVLLIAAAFFAFATGVVSVILGIQQSF